MCLSLKQINDAMHALPGYLEGRCPDHPYFVSEADFQFSLAIVLKKLNPKLNIWLEKPVADPIVDNNRTWHIDICVEDDQAKMCYIELKYKTQQVNDLNFADQGAQTYGKVLYLRDVSRLERLEAGQKYAILLTNDYLYWTNTRRKSTGDSYRLHDGTELNGDLCWGVANLPNWLTNQGGIVSLKGKYNPKWIEFSNVPCKFQYLLLQV